MNTLKDRWQNVVQRVEEAARRSGRSPEEIQIVAVSKRMPTEALCEAFDAGISCFGESYLQEALPKMDALNKKFPEGNIDWHFIGALQSNKAKKLPGKFSLIQSVDRWSVAKELEKGRLTSGCPVRILLELNIANEASKAGANRAELFDLAQRISENTDLEINGVMSFPPYSENPEASRAHFRATREVFETLKSRNLRNSPCTEISMGVTHDFEVAVEEGATIVRVGTAIFGSRNP